MNDFIFKRSLLDKVVEITPKIIGGDRDIFIKSYERSIFSENGIDFLPTEEYKIIEDKGIFRGIHFQKNIPQKSLLTVLSGEAYIVAVDLNRKSPQLGKYEKFFLSGEEAKLIFVPEWYGVATISQKDDTTISVMTSGQYYEKYRAGICYDDATLNIQWPTGDFRVSEKDKHLMTFKEYLGEQQLV